VKTEILSLDGDADAAVETRIQIGWNKFRQLLPIRIYHWKWETDCTAVVCK